MNNDIRLFDRRLDFIIQDTDRVLALTKLSVLLQEFDQSITLLMSYLGEMATLDRGLRHINEQRKLKGPITKQEEVSNDDFSAKRADVVSKLNNTLDIVEKRRKVIAKIAESISKRSNSKTENKLPKVSSTKSSSENSTKKVVITPSFDKPEKSMTKEHIELQKAQLKMEKEREKQEKRLAKERAKMEKQLAKEREKMEKQLAKERAKLEKQLAKEREKTRKT